MVAPKQAGYLPPTFFQVEKEFVNESWKLARNMQEVIHLTLRCVHPFCR
jgi:DNA-binding XRE family transcriptional regulator